MIQKTLLKQENTPKNSKKQWKSEKHIYNSLNLYFLYFSPIRSGYDIKININGGMKKGIKVMKK